MKALCGAVVRTAPFGAIRSILRNLIVPTRSGKLVCRVQHAVSLFSADPMRPRQSPRTAQTFVHSCSQPCKETTMSQHYATHHKPTGLGNCMTVMWLTCHPFLMGHSCGQLVIDWLGSYTLCSPHELLVPRREFQFKTRCVLPRSLVVIIRTLR